MAISKKVLEKLSWGAHLVLAITICDLVPSIIGRVVVLVSIGMIGGIQNICIKNNHSDEEHGDEQR